MKKRILATVTIVMALLFIPLYVKADDVSGNMPETDTNENTVSSRDVNDTDDTVSSGNVTDTDSTVSSGDTTDTDTPDLSEPVISTTYYDVLLQKEVEQQNYEIYRAGLQVQLMNSQLLYLAELEKEWAEKYDIEAKKLELGYSTAVTVEEVKSQHDAVLRQIESAKDLQAYNMDVITLYGGEYQEVSVSEALPALNDNYEEKFLTASAQKLYYEQLVQGYIYNLQTVEAGTEEARILETQLQLAQLDMQQYEIGLQLYVKELRLQYADIGRNVADLNNQIRVMEMKIANAELLLEKGKITGIQLIELRNELRGLQYEKQSLLYDANAILYILNHQIDNQSVSSY